MDGTPFLTAVSHFLEMALQFQDLEFVDFGGGFGIPYHKLSGEKEFDLTLFGAALEELVEEAGLGPKQKLIGRAVDLAVYMEKTPDNRRQISSIIKVNKFNHKEDFYETETLYLASAA